MSGGAIDAGRFVGVPFVEYGRDYDGADCWGLLRLVYRDCLGVDLPAWDGVGWEKGCDRAALADFMRAHAEDWVEVGAGCEREGDGLMFRMMGRPVHVGVILAAGRVLHTEKSTGGKVERYDGLRWRRRIIGFYRHKALIGAGEGA